MEARQRLGLRFSEGSTEPDAQDSSLPWLAVEADRQCCLPAGNSAKAGD